MKIFLGPAGIPTVSPDKTTENGIKTVKDLALNAMEIEFVRNIYLNNEHAKRVGTLAKSLGIELSIHAPYFINLCNPEKQKASMWRIMQSVERAAHMGAYVVVFHPGFYGKLEREEAFERVKTACKRMAERIKNRNWKVFLGLETTGKVSQFGTLEEIIEICKKIKKCVPVVDFAHIFARNNGKIDYKDIFDKIEELKLSHLHTHFSGIVYTNKGEKYHIPIKNKKPDFQPLAKEILKRKIDITIISESPVLEQDSLIMKRTFEKLGYRFKI